MPAYHPSAKLPQPVPTAGVTTATQAPAAVVAAPGRIPVVGVDFPQNAMVQVPETTVVIGKDRKFPSFGWDNEYGHRAYKVPAFSASQFKVSNGEFFAFVQDGGYSNSSYWTAAGWQWRAFRNAKTPSQFIRTGPQGKHEYVLRLLYDATTEVPWDWPVVVNYHEAAAFANWKSAVAMKEAAQQHLQLPQHDGGGGGGASAAGKKSGATSPTTVKQYRVMTELEHRAIREHTFVATDTDRNITDSAVSAAVPANSVEQEVVANVGGFNYMEKVR
jgi:hypothetical protein